jgi:hypothetical protein
VPRVSWMNTTHRFFKWWHRLRCSDWNCINLLDEIGKVTVSSSKRILLYGGAGLVVNLCFYYYIIIIIIIIIIIALRIVVFHYRSSRFQCHECIPKLQGRTHGGRLPVCSPPPNTPKPKLKKKHNFCRHDDIKNFTWFTLRLKSADDQYIKILKNELLKFKKKQEDWTLWVIEYVVIFVCI